MTYVPPNPLRLLAILALALSTPLFAETDSTAIATRAINTLGLDLLRQQNKTQPNANQLISPYSIQSALLLAYLGSDGTTRTEMQRVLHYQADEQTLLASFQSLHTALEIPPDPDGCTLKLANRLFLERSQPLLPSFRAQLGPLDCPIESLDFIHQPEPSRQHINHWVAEHTNQKITDLLPPTAIDKDTRLALANAVYFNGPWANSFDGINTSAQSFRLSEKIDAKTPTLHKIARFGYSRLSGHELIALPYVGDRIQLLILLPDKLTSTPLAKVTPELLAKGQTLRSHLLNLALPKFQLTPAATNLSNALQALGLNTAFDHPTHSANFSRIAQPTPEGYLKLSAIYHKCFIDLLRLA